MWRTFKSCAERGTSRKSQPLHDVYQCPFMEVLFLISVKSGWSARVPLFSFHHCLINVSDFRWQWMFSYTTRTDGWQIEGKMENTVKRAASEFGVCPFPSGKFYQPLAANDQKSTPSDLQVQSGLCRTTNVTFLEHVGLLAWSSFKQAVCCTLGLTLSYYNFLRDQSSSVLSSLTTS